MKVPQINGCRSTGKRKIVTCIQCIAIKGGVITEADGKNTLLINVGRVAVPPGLSLPVYHNINLSYILIAIFCSYMYIFMHVGNRISIPLFHTRSIATSPSVIYYPYTRTCACVTRTV